MGEATPLSSSWGSSSTAQQFSLAFILATILIFFVVRRRRGAAKTAIKSSTKRMPGPRQYFLGNYLNLLELANRKKAVSVLMGWCRSHPGSPIVSVALGPVDVVLLLSPHYIQKLVGSMAVEHLGRPPVIFEIYKPVEWFDGIIHSQGKKWKERRKLMNPHFSHGSLLRNVPELNDGGRRLVRGLEALFDDKAEAEGEQPRPIMPLLNEVTLAAILKTTFGIDVNDRDTPSKELSTVIKEGYNIVATRLSTPWLANDSLWRLSPLSKKLRGIYEKTRQVLEERIKMLATSSADSDDDDDGSPKGHHRKSLLRDLIAAGLPTDGIYEETLTMIAGGYETTEASLQSLFFFLALHPEAQERARAEVDSVFETHVLEEDGDDFCGDAGNIAGSDLKKLQYLEQCILEALRIAPTVPAIPRQLSGPLKLDEDLELPAGTVVGVWLPAIHMNPDIYPEPEKFDPDRWSPEERARRHPYSYLAFAAGPRKCIGYKFAMNEMLVLAAHVLRNFTFRTSDSFENVAWRINVTLTPETPMKFVFEKRNNTLHI